MRHSPTLFLSLLLYIPYTLPFLIPSSCRFLFHSLFAIFQLRMNLRPLYGVSLNPLSPEVKIQKDTMTDRFSLAAANTKQQNKQYALEKQEA